MLLRSSDLKPKSILIGIVVSFNRIFTYIFLYFLNLFLLSLNQFLTKNYRILLENKQELCIRQMSPINQLKGDILNLKYK